MLHLFLLGVVWSIEDKRIKNFTYPISDVISWSIITTYEILQMKIIADTFGFNIEDIELVN